MNTKSPRAWMKKAEETPRIAIRTAARSASRENLAMGFQERPELG
jgi:hypothetical protein